MFSLHDPKRLRPAEVLQPGVQLAWGLGRTAICNPCHAGPPGFYTVFVLQQLTALSNNVTIQISSSIVMKVLPCQA